jgi:hypothetical protein
LDLVFVRDFHAKKGNEERFSVADCSKSASDQPQSVTDCSQSVFDLEQSVTDKEQSEVNFSRFWTGGGKK